MAMPSIEVIYGGLIRATAACHSETYELPADATVGTLLAEIVRRHGADAQPYLLSDDSSELAPGCAVLMSGSAARDLSVRLDVKQKVKVLVMSPMLVGG
jgi:hypothetical protein